MVRVGAKTEYSGGFFSGHTIAHANDGNLLIVGFSINTTSNLVTGVTYAGQAMTLLQSQQANNNGRWYYMYGMIDPAPGLNDVVISLSGAQNVAAGVVSVLDGLEFGTSAKAFGNSATPSVEVASEEGHLVIDVVGLQHPGLASLTPSSGQTELTKVLANDARNVATSEKAGAESVTMAWTANSSRLWAHMAVTISPLADFVTPVKFIAIEARADSKASIQGRDATAVALSARDDSGVSLEARRDKISIEAKV